MLGDESGLDEQDVQWKLRNRVLTWEFAFKEERVYEGRLLDDDGSGSS